MLAQQKVELALEHMVILVVVQGVPIVALVVFVEAEAQATRKAIARMVAVLMVCFIVGK